ncbi:hypothetical protein [Sigmofec virus UA08Rod_6727]|uniref:Uncharacterized protein n=1 Tax=Sigmofec virus UA08Rod_6727 TaxID=2929238 RepID=A0A976R765_9VIRU|nr:hypothetical protein [Sigmofec virus UA08Rod_6727]
MRRNRKRRINMYKANYYRRRLPRVLRLNLRARRRRRGR